MKILVICLILLGILYSDTIATIENISGKVKVLKNDTIRATKANLQQSLEINDMLITSKNSLATIKLTDGSLITLDAETKLLLDDINKLTQKDGQIFYNIKTQKGKPLKVATNFATIGVKGTKFIINNTKEKNIALKSGLISVSSNDANFEIHRAKHNSLDYATFQQNYNIQFKQYKQKDQEEFIEFKKQFDLLPNRYITFENKIVREKAIDKTIGKKFEYFENFQK